MVTESCDCVSGKGGLVGCEQDGNVSSGVGRDWCGWACDRPCDLGSCPFFCRHQCSGMEGGFFFHCELYIVVESIDVVQKFC
jgi:hypothetical protein